jgi:glucose/mannose transport system substrate-binding protein
MTSIQQNCKLTTLVGLALASFTVQAAEVEVLHYWTSGGEAKSVAELKKIMEAKGDTWKDFAVAGGGGENAMTVLKSRVVAGNAPTAAQIKGPSIQEWANEGVLANLSDTAVAGKWDALLPPVVSNAMKSKGSYVAVPVNVHRVNWMWVNPAVFKTAGASVPKTWADFPAAAEKLQKAGFIAVAHGGQPWQDFTIFESVVLGVGGSDFYQKSMVKLDPAALSSPTMEKAFDTFRTVRKYVDKDFAGRDWNLATQMIIQGKAGMQFMGDWAKGEFTAAGKKAGSDYLCVDAPGTDGQFTFNIDSFAMFAQQSADAKKGQANLASSIMSPEFQEIFNLNKGSIPARLDVKMDKFDDCAKKSNADFVSTSKKGTLVPSVAHGMAVPAASAGAIQDVVTQFFNSDMSSKSAVEKLAAAAKTK